jgi:hypothetical protein
LLGGDRLDPKPLYKEQTPDKGLGVAVSAKNSKKENPWDDKQTPSVCGQEI